MLLHAIVQVNTVPSVGPGIIAEFKGLSVRERNGAFFVLFARRK